MHTNKNNNISSIHGIIHIVYLASFLFIIIWLSRAFASISLRFISIFGNSRWLLWYRRVILHTMFGCIYSPSVSLGVRFDSLWSALPLLLHELASQVANIAYRACYNLHGNSLRALPHMLHSKYVVYFHDFFPSSAGCCLFAYFYFDIIWWFFEYCHKYLFILYTGEFKRKWKIV